MPCRGARFVCPPHKTRQFTLKTVSGGIGIFGRKKKTEFSEKLPEKLPRHIAIIMDGNGRWAKKRALPRRAGHAAGSENFRRIAIYCKEIGIKYLTVYAFSTENWSRPPDEVAEIFRLLEKYLHEAIEKMQKDRVKLKFLGDLEKLPGSLRALIAETEEISAQYEGIQANICLNYGGRDEIVRAARSWLENPPETPNEAAFSARMYGADIPDPDLIIRPSGEMRLSNFLLWQSAYSEFYFTNTLWPDFSPAELNEILREYARRDRRYGGI